MLASFTSFVVAPTAPVIEKVFPSTSVPGSASIIVIWVVGVLYLRGVYASNEYCVLCDFRDTTEIRFTNIANIACECRL